MMMISEKEEAPFSSSLSHKMPPMLDLRFGQERPLWRKRHDPNGSGEIVLVCRVDFHTVPFLILLQLKLICRSTNYLAAFIRNNKREKFGVGSSFMLDVIT